MDTSSPEVSDRKLEGDELINALVVQLDWYFSRENLANDAFLVSQMNAQKYVPVDIIAKFPKVRTLTEDRNILLAAMQKSKNCDADEEGRMVRPTVQPERKVLILRDMAPDVPVADIQAIFDFDGAGKVVDIRSDVGDTWFVTFETQEDCLKTATALIGRTFNGKPIRCRVKSENLLRGFYVQPGSAGQGQAASEAGGQQWQTNQSNGYYGGYTGYGSYSSGGYGGGAWQPQGSQPAYAAPNGFRTPGDFNRSPLHADGGSLSPTNRGQGDGAASGAPRGGKGGRGGSRSGSAGPQGGSTGVPAAQLQTQQAAPAGIITDDAQNQLGEKRGKAGRKGRKAAQPAGQSAPGKPRSQPQLGPEHFPALSITGKPGSSIYQKYSREEAHSIVKQLCDSHIKRPEGMPSAAECLAVRDLPIARCQLLDTFPIMYPASPSPAMHPQKSSDFLRLPELDLNKPTPTAAQIVGTKPAAPSSRSAKISTPQPPAAASSTASAPEASLTVTRSPKLTAQAPVFVSSLNLGSAPSGSVSTAAAGTQANAPSKSQPSPKQLDGSSTSGSPSASVSVTKTDGAPTQPSKDQSKEAKVDNYAARARNGENPWTTVAAKPRKPVAGDNKALPTSVTGSSPANAVTSSSASTPSSSPASADKPQDNAAPHSSGSPAAGVPSNANATATANAPTVASSASAAKSKEATSSMPKFSYADLLKKTPK